jgi:hypothetical protein
MRRREPEKGGDEETEGTRGGPSPSRLLLHASSSPPPPPYAPLVLTASSSQSPHPHAPLIRTKENAIPGVWKMHREENGKIFQLPNPVLMNEGALHVAKLMKLMPCPPKPDLLQKGDDIILRGDFSWKRKFGRISLVYGSGPSVASLFRSFPFSDVLPTRRCVRR